MGAPPPLATLRHAGIHNPSRRRILAAVGALVTAPIAAACRRPDETSVPTAPKAAESYISTDPNLPFELPSSSTSFWEPSTAGIFRPKDNPLAADIVIRRDSSGEFKTLEQYKANGIRQNLEKKVGKGKQIPPYSLGETTATTNNHKAIFYTVNDFYEKGTSTTFVCFMDDNQNFWTVEFTGNDSVQQDYERVYERFKDFYSSITIQRPSQATGPRPKAEAPKAAPPAAAAVDLPQAKPIDSVPRGQEARAQGLEAQAALKEFDALLTMTQGSGGVQLISMKTAPETEGGRRVEKYSWIYRENNLYNDTTMGELKIDPASIETSLRISPVTPADKANQIEGKTTVTIKFAEQHRMGRSYYGGSDNAMKVTLPKHKSADTPTLRGLLPPLKHAFTPQWENAEFSVALVKKGGAWEVDRTGLQPIRYPFSKYNVGQFDCEPFSTPKFNCQPLVVQ